MKSAKRSAFLIFILASAIGSKALLGGERIGNGGDPRRHRVHRSMNYVYNVMMSADITPVRGPEIDWVAGYSQSFVRILERSTSTWVDRQADGSYKCLIATKPTRKSEIQFTWSYTGCDQRAENTYYVSEILNALFSHYSATDQILRDRVRAFYLIANQRIEKILTQYPEDRSPQAKTRNTLPFPESDLKNPILMDAHVNEARSMAVRALTSFGPSYFAFYDFTSTDLARNFLKKNRTSLLTEVQNSKILWDGEATSCADTEPKAGATIHLGSRQCREIKSIRDLAWMLVHESVHHLGVQDEKVADIIATAYLSFGWWFDTE